ncbi:flagellar basal body-associated FliL family protein [Xylophilus sp. GW821-FHT01B05]
MKLILIVLLVLGLGAGGAWYFLQNRAQSQSLDDDEDGAPAQASHAAAKAAPTFLPVDNMVVNLADTGGERFAQIGVTFEVGDAKTADQLKAYMPAIRNSMLMLISQRTAAELLQRDGKEKLAADIMVEAGRPLGYVPPAPAADGGERRRPRGSNPVRGVLFSSFIIQ